MKPEISSSFINIFLFLPCCAHLETASAWLVLSLRSDVNRKNLASIVVRDTTLAGPEKYAAAKKQHNMKINIKKFEKNMKQYDISPKVRFFYIDKKKRGTKICFHISSYFFIFLHISSYFFIFANMTSYLLIFIHVLPGRSCSSSSSGPTAGSAGAVVLSFRFFLSRPRHRPPAPPHRPIPRWVCSPRQFANPRPHPVHDTGIKKNEVLLN
jgi:hypothetical protein